MARSLQGLVTKSSGVDVAACTVTGGSAASHRKRRQSRTVCRISEHGRHVKYPDTTGKGGIIAARDEEVAACANSQ